MSRTQPAAARQLLRLDRPQSRAPRLPGGAGSRVAQIMKNRGNDAKEWLKTKEITFLRAANLALIAAGSASIRPQKEQAHPFSRKTNRSLPVARRGAATTRSRLHGTAVTPRDGSRPGGNVR